MDGARKTSDGIPTRRSLLKRLQRWDDSEGWQQFFDTYWRLIYAVATKAGLADPEAQDVVQETIVTVARQMPNFQYDPAVGSFKSWLYLITRRRIADHLRREYRRPKQAAPDFQHETGTPVLERVPDPRGQELEAIWEGEWKQHQLALALERLKSQVEPRHFQIFDCHVMKEWPVAEVARTFGVSPNQVYLIKHRLSALLAKRLREIERRTV